MSCIPARLCSAGNFRMLRLFLLWGDDKIGIVGGMEPCCLYLKSKSPWCFCQMDGISENRCASRSEWLLLKFWVLGLFEISLKSVGAFKLGCISECELLPGEIVLQEVLEILGSCCF